MLTQAIIIGMSPEQFWDDDPSLFFNYLDAFEQKRETEMKIELEKINFTAWLNGVYIDYALAVNNPLAKRKGKYLEKPYNFNNIETEVKTEEAEEERKKQEEAIALKQFYQFGRYAKMYNKQYFGEEEGE